MAYMTLQCELRANSYIELTGQDVKLWVGEGLPTYEGPIDGLEEYYPAVFAELIERKLIKPTNPHGDEAPM